MKTPKTEKNHNSDIIKKNGKLINLKKRDRKLAEIEYEKYYDRIKLLSRGV
ncbi:MAG: hypothetical protein KAH67_02460 [Flavobacteriaceae bacterium]|nr:hypothetical protein [Flavobacteriaceae bacterium]